MVHRRIDNVSGRCCLIGQHPTEYREPLSMAWTFAAVHEAAIEAIARAGSGAGPTLLECKTYRYYDHVGRDFGILRRDPGRDCLVACARPHQVVRETLIARGGVRRHHGRCDHDTHWGRHGTRRLRRRSRRRIRIPMPCIQMSTRRAQYDLIKP